MRPFARKSHEEFTLLVVEEAPRLRPVIMRASSTSGSAAR